MASRGSSFIPNPLDPSTDWPARVLGKNSASDFKYLMASPRWPSSRTDVDVAAAGGWRDTRALKLSYQQADPATMKSVVEAGN